jgi:pimeloyl-ACP methyl ester carboxylesterase
VRARAIFGLAALVLLVGCTAEGPERDRDAAGIASGGGLEAATISTGWFDLRAYRRETPGAKTLAVFIEGDGFAYATPRLPSPDPTPLDPVSLRLAAADTATRVLYLGRPCQYAVGRTDARCDPTDWTTRRFARPAIRALNTAIDEELTRLAAERIVLIGYSGGGVVAALVAAMRHDVDRLVTIAAPLDTEAWTRLLGLSPLSDSMSPADEVGRLRKIPQIHFAGGRDSDVPAEIIQSFVHRLGPDAPAEFVVIDGYDHHCCWARDAAALLRRAFAP